MQHQITSTEPKLVTQKLDYDPKDGLLTPIDDPIEILDMETKSEYKEYECKCGKQFDTIMEAENHMEKVKQG